MKVPRYIKDVIETGELSHLDGNEESLGNSFRLYERKSNKNKCLIENIIKLAERICDWAAKNKAEAFFSRNINDAWYRRSIYESWKSISYVEISIGEPVRSMLLEIEQKEKLDIIEKPSIKLLIDNIFNDIEEEMKKNKIGYLRAAHDGNRWWSTWFENNEKLKTDEAKKRNRLYRNRSYIQNVSKWHSRH